MKKYIWLAAIIVIVYSVQALFLSAGGIGADSLSYFGIAADFPQVIANLFPLGFPALIKVFQSVFQDYFWASKVLNISMAVCILLFSYFKQFYFKETVLLFTGKTLFFALNLVSSEGPFIFLLYFLIYFFHEKFEEKIKSGTFVFFASLLMVLLFTVRYSGIYIYLGILFFWLFLVLKSKPLPIKIDLFQFLWISGIGITSYLSFNYFTFGSFTGEHLRGAPAQYAPIYIFRDILGMTNVIDPFIGLKPSSNSFGSLAFQVGVMIIDFILLGYLIKLYRSKKDLIKVEFHYLLWLIAGIYTIGLFISGLFQQIEEMNVRMLAAANFCLFFSFLKIYFKGLQSDRLIFKIGCFFLGFLTLYSLKSPDNYLKNKQQIAQQMPKFAGKKYLFDNEQNQKLTTTYHLPLLKKTFKYQHTNAQRGFIKQSIAGTINPTIKWLKYDTIPNKSLVLYTSDLVLE